MEQEPDHGDDGQEGGGGFSRELVLSYVAFAKNAIARRKWLVVLVAVLGIALTITIAKYLPRTYACETVMMTVSSGVLDDNRGDQPLAGAEGLIMSHDNLERLIKDIDLKRKYFARRPPLLALKDRLIRSVLGPMDDKTMTAMLIGTLGTKLTVEVEKDTLTISVEWHDANTAAEIAGAARESFVRKRHAAEMSAFQDKMAILDSHAVALRSEISTLAEQMKGAMLAKRSELEAEAKSDSSKLPAAVKRKLTVRAPQATVSDEQVPALTERLAALKAKLSTVENDRAARIRDEQTKLDDLKLRLTPSHPAVMTQQERVGIASQVSSELMQMRDEVQDIESQIRQRQAMQQRPSGSSVLSTAASETLGSGPLPPEILDMLDERDVDPALAAQISGAVVRYGSLRDDVRGAKLALDTAQAAFTRRYQVTVPVEVPNRPIKPKMGIIFGIGAVISILLGLLLPILLELRRDVVVERWQVHQFQLPVLAELRLPPGNPKDGGGA